MWSRAALVGVAAGAGGAALLASSGRLFSASSAATAQAATATVAHGYLGLIGNTPLVELPTLSRATGCRILAKAEHVNPTGSIKDRAAKYMVLDALEQKLVKEGGTLIEATGGNTGVSLAPVCKSLGIRTVFTMPSYVSKDKIKLMETMGAETILCDPCPFKDPNHFYQKAKGLAEEKGYFWPDQFENLANSRGHIEGTAKEIWEQSGGTVDAFICASGTGGTIGGCSTFFRDNNTGVKVYLVDPPGSSMYGFITNGTLEPDPRSTITEGIGIGRITGNFALSSCAGAFQAENQEILDMTYHLLEKEGIFVGPAAGCNVCGAVKLARELGPGHTIVTILCDTGERYLSTVFSPEWLEGKELALSAEYKNDDGSIAFVHK